MCMLHMTTNINSKTKLIKKNSFKWVVPKWPFHIGKFNVVSIVNHTNLLLFLHLDASVAQKF
jgi:hypothetical protein